MGIGLGCDAGDGSGFAAECAGEETGTLDRGDVGGGVGGVRRGKVRSGALLTATVEVPLVAVSAELGNLGIGEARDRSAALLMVRGLTAESSGGSWLVSVIWVY